MLEKLDQLPDMIAKAVQEATIDIPANVAGVIRESANKDVRSKRASDCSEFEYHSFSISEGALEIPLITNDSFQTNYKKNLADCEQKLQLVQVAQEKKKIQPLTELFLRRRLMRLQGQSRIAFGKEVGFHTTGPTKIHGLADKASCEFGQNPDLHRPGTGNVKLFDSPVPLFGSWEDKGLDVDIQHNHLAQLASSMVGFVQGARRRCLVQYNQFGGILVAAKTVSRRGQYRKVFFCKCLVWMLVSGQEICMASRELVNPLEFASGVEWWINQSLHQQQLASKTKQSLNALVSQPRTPVHSITEGPDEQHDDEAAEKENQGTIMGASLQGDVLPGSFSWFHLDDEAVRVKKADMWESNDRISDWLLPSARLTLAEAKSKVVNM
jgi:hypothetical protein